MHANDEPTGLARSPSRQSFMPAKSRSEVLSALRCTLDELPLQHRQMVALHFAGGLTQEEIAAELSLNKSTVDARITSALNQIRSKFPEYESDTAHHINSSLLNEAICAGYPVPPGLFDRVMRQVERHCPERVCVPTDTSRKEIRVTLIRAVLSLATLAATAAVCWVVYGTSNG